MDGAPDAGAVAAVVARALGLPAAPNAGDLLDGLRGWDSLGALNVLLSLEAAFGVELRPADVAEARRVGDLADAVARAAEGAAA